MVELFAYALFLVVLNWVFYRLTKTISFQKKPLVLTLLTYIMVVLMVQFHGRAQVPGLQNTAFFILLHLSFVIVLFRFLRVTLMRQITDKVTDAHEHRHLHVVSDELAPKVLPLMVSLLQIIGIFSGWAEELANRLV